MTFPVPQAADEDADDGGDAHPVKRVRVNSSDYCDKGALSCPEIMEFAEKKHAEKEARHKAKANRQTKREDRQAQRHKEALKCNAGAMALAGGGADVECLSVKNLQAILLARCVKPKGKKADLVEQVKVTLIGLPVSPLQIAGPDAEGGPDSNAGSASDLGSDSKYSSS